MRLEPTPMGGQVREVALATRMFASDTLPWECEHEFVEMRGLGRRWSTCTHCGFLERLDDRRLLLRLLRSVP